MTYSQSSILERENDIQYDVDGERDQVCVRAACDALVDGGPEDDDEHDAAEDGEP